MGTKGKHENKATKNLNNETKEEPGCTTRKINTKNKAHSDTTIIEVSDQRVNTSENCSYQKGKEVTHKMIRDTTNLHETRIEPTRKLQDSTQTCLKEIQEDLKAQLIATSIANKRKVTEEDTQSKDEKSVCYFEDLTTQIERVNSEYSKLISMLELKSKMLYRNTGVDNSYKESFN